MLDAWATLEVSQQASLDEIRTSYKRLAKKFHPDSGGEASQFILLQQAYDWLIKHYQQAAFTANTNFFRGPHITVSTFLSIAESLMGTKRHLTLTVNHQNKEIQIDIPAGIEHGDVVKYAGIGVQSFPGDPGDVYVRIFLTIPPRFELVGPNLVYSHEISVWQAILGTNIEFDGSFDEPIVIRVPAGTQPNTEIQIPGNGVWDRQRQQRGDLIVRLKVTIPPISNQMAQIISDWV